MQVVLVDGTDKFELCAEKTGKLPLIRVGTDIDKEAGESSHNLPDLST